jgi:signal transduction histidine kinase/ActR/RegA family two-component response regulator
MAPPDSTRERRIANESVRLFFEAIANERFQIYLPTLGAVVIGFVAWKDGGVAPSSIASWCALVGVAETALNAIDRRFIRSPPPEDAFTAWAWAKTAIVMLLALAYGLGPILMHSPGVAICTLFPSWAILILDGALVYACAGFLPSLVGAMATATLPPAIWLLIYGQGIDRVTAICLFTALPFTMAFGVFSARNLRSLVMGRIEIADLLRRERELSNKLLEAQRDRSRFYSAASHDLRQPLHALGFYVSLLSGAGDGSQRREIEARLSECVNGLDGQFNAIIGMAQADHALEKAAPTPVALQGVLERVVARGAHQAMMQNLELTLAKTSRWAIVDADLLERVLGNLLNNALRYTRIGRVLIGVRPAGDCLRVVVADSGVGIPPEETERIFEDFYQVGNPERNRDKGFGLGLAIVKRLCTAMNWRIEVRSSVGRGSLFSVVLPRAEAQPEPAPALPERPQPALDMPDGLVVLLVDDDPLVRDATARLLERWGVRAELCATGEQALSRLAQRRDSEKWHVLLDQRLADGESGLSLAKSILAAPGPPPRMSLLTGETEEAVLSASRALGLPVLRKPLKAIQLRAVLTSPAPEFDGGGRSAHAGMAAMSEPAVAGRQTQP